MGFGDTQAIAKTHVFIVLCRGFILFSLCLYMNKSSIVTTDCISHAYEFCITPIVVIIVSCTAFLVLVSWIKRSRLFWRLLSMPLVINLLIMSIKVRKVKGEWNVFSKLETQQFLVFPNC